MENSPPYVTSIVKIQFTRYLIPNENKKDNYRSSMSYTQHLTTTIDQHVKLHQVYN